MSEAEAGNDQDLVTEIESQMVALEDRRRLWEPFWSEVVEFCFPARQFDPIKDQTKTKKPKVNFNNRAAFDVNLSSAGFQGYTANRRSVWAKLQFEDIAMMGEYMVSDWLEECERILNAVFSRFGLYEALGEMVPDGHTIGTGVIYIEEVSPGRIAFNTRHPLSVWISENAFGEVDTVLEEIPMSYRSMIERFGEEKLSERSKEASKKNPYQMTAVRHLVKPMDERYRKFSQKDFDNRMPFISLWYEKTDKLILDVGGYWEFPYAVWRYRKNAGEEYGRSPGQDALGDIMTGNQMTKSRIKLANTIADPAYMVDAALEGQDTVMPGVHIYREKPTETIEPIQIGANYPITKDNEDRQDQLIDAHFNIPIYLMLQQMEQNMTAREVIERTGEKAAILGPTTGRYEKEVLQPIIRRTFNLLQRSGILPQMPPSLIGAEKNAKLKIEFLGFLAQLQQRYYQTTGINATVGYVQAVGAMFPEALDWVDQDNLMVKGMESVGAPASVVREKETVEKLRQMRLEAQQAAQQQAAQQQGQEAMIQNADKLGKKPEEGSPLENMGKAMAQQGMAQ